MRAEPDLAPVEDRDALAHIALALEPVDAPPAGRYRQADALGDLGGGLARVALEFAKDFYLEWIKIGHSFPIDHKSDRKCTRLNSSHSCASRMPSSVCRKKKQNTKIQ